MSQNLPDEVLDAAIDAYLGGPNAMANRRLRLGHLRERMQAVADALLPHIRDLIVQQEGHQEWRVSGFPGQEYGPYNFVWGKGEPDGEGEHRARAFVAMVTEPGRARWVDGPHVEYRTVLHHEGPWLPADKETPDAD